MAGNIDNAGGDDLILDFGPGFGLWARMNNASWSQLHSLSPNIVTAGNIDNKDGDDLVVHIHTPDGQQHTEEEAHRNRQHDDVGEGNEEHLYGVLQGHPSHQDLLDQIEDAAHDHQKGVGHETEQRRRYDLAGHQTFELPVVSRTRCPDAPKKRLPQLFRRGEVFHRYSPRTQRPISYIM